MTYVASPRPFATGETLPDEVLLDHLTGLVVDTLCAAAGARRAHCTFGKNRSGALSWLAAGAGHLGCPSPDRH